MRCGEHIGRIIEKLINNENLIDMGKLGRN